MTFTDFWKAFGGTLVAIVTSFAGFIIWLKLSISSLEGRVNDLEKHMVESDKCLNTLKEKSSDEKLREYKAGETDKKITNLSEQIGKGFAELNGTINAMNIQNVHILEQLSSQQKSIEEMRSKINRHERIIHLAGLPGQVDIDEP